MLKDAKFYRAFFYASLFFFVLSLGYFFSSFVYVFFLTKTTIRNTIKTVKTDELSRVRVYNFGNLFQETNLNFIQNNLQNPPKPLNFTLLGTLITDSIRSAMLKIDNEIKIFRLNQSINEKTKIIQINDFYILIDIDGRKQLVELNRDFKHEPPKENLPPLSSVVPIPQGAQNFVIDKRLVDEMTKDVGQFLKDVRIIPYFENGVTAGFKFDFVRQGSLLEQNGIKQGDKIISINGNPVKTTEDSFKLYNMLRTEKYVSLVLEDQNGRRTLNYEIR